MGKRLFNRMVNYALYGQSLSNFVNEVLRGKKIEGLNEYWAYAKQVAHKVLRG